MDSEEEVNTEINRTTSQSSTTLCPTQRWLRRRESRTSSYVHKRLVTKSRFPGSLPRDLAWEILSRLPAKSALRYRSVSKLWSSIITNRCFINSFPALPSLLLIFQKGNTLFIFSFPQHQNPTDPYSQVERYEVMNPHYLHFSCSGSVHGLICFQTQTQLVIWNPTMRLFSPLPQHENGLTCKRGLLGYDPIECKYKVLSFLTDEGICVLTLGAQESWRMIKASPVHFPNTTKGQCINGILYYEARVGLPLEHAIMRFDLKSETFNLIEFPKKYHTSSLLVTCLGKLALVRSKKKGVEIWILEDAENQKWSYEHVIYTPPENLHLKGVTDGGELVYTSSCLYESFHVVYLDLKRKSLRETKFEGIANGIFRQLKGLGWGPLRDLDVFPNHIESLFSL